MTAKRTRAALYLRVSTTDGQTTENQRLALAKVAGHCGREIIQTYGDAGIRGVKGRDRRLIHSASCDAAVTVRVCVRLAGGAAYPPRQACGGVYLVLVVLACFIAASASFAVSSAVVSKREKSARGRSGQRAGAGSRIVREFADRNPVVLTEGEIVAMQLAAEALNECRRAHQCDHAACRPAPWLRCR